MKMIKKFSAFICIICIITSVSFAYDRSNAFHSNDYFTNDLQYVNSIQSYFDTYGMFTSVAIRPNVIYGWNYVIGISTYFFVSTHGSSDGSNLKISDTGRYKSENVSTNHCRIAFLSACYSAKTNTTSGNNLCQTFVNNGAEAAIGYNALVTTSHTRVFETQFYYNYVSNEYSLATSKANALVYVNNMFGSSCNLSSATKTFGDTTICIDD